MTATVFALVDVNNFYVSCERVFDYRYKKSGTMLMELQPKAQRQVTLFEDPVAIERRERLNSTMDRINVRYCRRTVGLAGAGTEKA